MNQGSEPVREGPKYSESDLKPFLQNPSGGGDKRLVGLLRKGWVGVVGKEWKRGCRFVFEGVIEVLFL